MSSGPAPRVTPLQQRRTLFDSAVSAASRLLLASEGRIVLDTVARSEALDDLFAFLEEMNDALPKA